MLTKLPESHSFNLQLSEFSQKFEQINTESGRFYKTPKGIFPSVTTKLSAHYKVDLSGWIDRVGQTEANKITSQALSRGTRLHKIAENYFLGNDYMKGIMPVDLESFLKIKPILDKNISTIYGIERFLANDHIETAGTSDLICVYDGIDTIVDFKTARRPKKEEWIQSYITQSVTYAFMAMFDPKLRSLKFRPEQICIIIAVAGDEPQIFKKPISDSMWMNMIKIMKTTIVEVPKELNESTDFGRCN